MVTAWNPWSTPRGRLRNALANAALYLVLRRRGEVLRSVGSDVSGGTGWREPGFALELGDAEEVARIGATFGQHAIFIARPEGLELLACAS